MEMIPHSVNGILAVMLFGAFIKIATTLSIVRHGIGLDGAGFGAVIIAVSFGLSLFAIDPVLKSQGGVDALFKSQGAVASISFETFRDFVREHSDQAVVRRLEALRPEPVSKAKDGEAQHQPTLQGKKEISEKPFVKDGTLIGAFLISELREAFLIGFYVLIPFVVIDLLVVNILMALSVTQISQQVISLPLKLLFFIALDAWLLLGERLLGPYSQIGG